MFVFIKNFDKFRFKQNKKSEFFLFEHKKDLI